MKVSVMMEKRNLVAIVFTIVVIIVAIILVIVRFAALKKRYVHDNEDKI